MRHVVVGAGPVGWGTAELLVAAGHRVSVVTRSGRAPRGSEAVRADATDRVVMAQATRDAAVIYNCANPPYDRWASDWPPIAASLLAAAESSGAVLVTMSNLYGYGPTSGEMTESTPLAATGGKGRVRAAMWREALGAHEAGRARVTEARASDFFGPGLKETSFMGERVVPRLLAGRPVRLVMGGSDIPHSWTYIDDVARTLVVLGSDDRAWGRAWHVPTNPARTAGQMIAGLAAAAGRPTPAIRTLRPVLLRAAGAVSPVVRELQETRYQFERPFVIDSRAVTAVFGLCPTPWEQALAATVDWWRTAERHTIRTAEPVCA